MHPFFQLARLPLIILVATIVASVMVYNPAHSPAQGVCSPVSKTLQGTQLTLSSASIGFTMIDFRPRHENVVIDGLIDGSEDAYVQHIDGLPLSLTYKVSLKEPTQSGRLYFGVYRAGCSEPDLLWLDLKPTKWGYYLARDKGVPTAPVQLPNTSGCKNAEVRQDITYDGDKNIHTIRLSGLVAGNSIVAIHGTDVSGDTVSINDQTYSAPFTHQLLQPVVGMDIVITTPPGSLPFVVLTVETKCGSWFGGVEYMEEGYSPNP
jgi:hypothetical protein